MSDKKLLGAHVPEVLHRQAHMTARSKGLGFSDWFRELVERNIDPEVRAYFLDSDAQQIEQNPSTPQAA